MNIVVGDVSSPPAPTFLTQGFRPFFLAAGLWSAASLALWIVMFATGSAVPSRFDPLAWHIHEMLFGFVVAAVAGFLLTAIPTWTKRLPISGFPLAVLAGLWLLGRVACLISYRHDLMLTRQGSCIESAWRLADVVVFGEGTHNACFGGP